MKKPQTKHQETHKKQEQALDKKPIEAALFHSLDPNEAGLISSKEWISRMHDAGIQPDDLRFVSLFKALEEHTEINFDFFCEWSKNHFTLIRKALTGHLIIPDFRGFSETINTIFNQVKTIKSGHVASYIPQLAKVSPEKFGVAICTVDGQRYSIGNANEYFSLQSTSKPINYCLALEQFGENCVHEHVGREQSGSGFNAITLDYQNRPHNPMINAGAIMCCSMILPKAKPAERFDFVLSAWNRLSAFGNPLFNNTVFLSEKQTADRNFALAYFMREKKKFPDNTNLLETLELYFQCCSIELTCEGMSMVASTLANGGINPITGERIFSANTVKNCLSLMNSCGMYDFSGEFSFTIGLPAKSGVGGGLMVVVPNVMGLCIWSPPLDKNGNSSRGVEFCRELVNRFNFHSYDSLVSESSGKTDPRKKPFETKLDHITTLFWAAFKGDTDEIKHMIALGININEADYDGRTALHLAASEGHLKCVEFLLTQNAIPNPKDRWGNTPLDDAKRENHQDIIDFLSKGLPH